MSKQRKEQRTRRNRGLSLAITLALALFGASGKPGQVGITVIGVGMVLCLCYAFSDWASKASLTGVEKSGRWIVLLFVSCVICAAYAWKFWPEEKPVMHIVDFAPRVGPFGRATNGVTYSGNRAWVNVRAMNTAPPQAWRINPAGRIKMLPAPDSHTLYVAAEAATDQVFSDLRNDPILVDMPNHSVSPQGAEFAMQVISDQALSEDEVRRVMSGDLALFLGGIIKYKDAGGCVYKTEFCGYWRGNTHDMMQCSSGHSAEAVRTNDDCTPE